MKTPRKKAAPKATSAGAAKASTMIPDVYVATPDPETRLSEDATLEERDKFVSEMLDYFGVPWFGDLSDHVGAPYFVPRKILLSVYEFFKYALPQVLLRDEKDSAVKDGRPFDIPLNSDTRAGIIGLDCFSDIFVNTETLAGVLSMDDSECEKALAFFRAGAEFIYRIDVDSYREGSDRYSGAQSRRAKERKGKPNLKNRPLKEWAFTFIRETLDGKGPTKNWASSISYMLVGEMSKGTLPAVDPPSRTTINTWIKEYQSSKRE